MLALYPGLGCLSVHADAVAGNLGHDARQLKLTPQVVPIVIDPALHEHQVLIKVPVGNHVLNGVLAELGVVNGD